MPGADGGARGAVAQDESQRVVGALVEDQLSGRSFPVHARAVINATGPFVDSVRPACKLVMLRPHQLSGGRDCI